jgi:hypothetical protein
MKILLALAFFLCNASLQAGITGNGTMHGDVGIGGMMVSGADLNRNFKSPTYDPNFGDALSLMVGVQGGYLTSFGFYMDLGFDVGPMRTITSKKTTTLLGAPYTVDEKIDFTQYRLLAIPGFMLPLGSKLLLSGQIGLGYAMVSGKYTQKITWAGTSESGYTITGSGFDYVPEVRLQYLMNPRMSAGLAVGWNGSKFSEINGCCGTGGYSGATFNNPAKNSAGEKWTIDHTGVFAKLVITTYLSDMVPGGAVEVQRAAEPAADPKAELQAGNQAYAAKDYASAESHCAAATQIDSGNAKAWQSLGNARLYQKKKAEALQAYDQSLYLDPGNTQLKAYVDKLRP